MIWPSLTDLPNVCSSPGINNRIKTGDDILGGADMEEMAWVERAVDGNVALQLDATFIRAREHTD